MLEALSASRVAEVLSIASLGLSGIFAFILVNDFIPLSDLLDAKT